MGAQLSLPGARQAADKGALKAFYAEDGPFDELKQAGYLLAVAFKIDSKIPPGKIEQVKNHKKLIKDLDAIKTAKAGEAVRASTATPPTRHACTSATPWREQATAAYGTARASLEVYLEGVELPPLGDAMYASQ